MIHATIIADSIGLSAPRLTTAIFKYPRFIHSELMTHRSLSKNSASSRAIPLKKMVEAVTDEPALPEYWGAEQKGMQSGGQLSPGDQLSAGTAWRNGGAEAQFTATRLGRIGVHKSICNRVLEPYAHMTVIVTGNERAWKHFFALRANALAQPEFQVLAFRFLGRYMSSQPKVLEAGDWHIPFGDKMPDLSLHRRIMIATARCARVSYLTHEGEHSVEKDLELYSKLSGADPFHASPFEHVAQAKTSRLADYQSGNFGHFWLQHRKQLPGEFTATTLDLNEVMTKKPDWISL